MTEAPRHAIVTGAASGLGRALAVALAREGWHVAVCDVDESGSQATLELIRGVGGSGQIEPLDVRSADEWQSLASRLRTQWPRLDLLVNNAGVATSGLVGRAPLDDWQWTIKTNLLGTIYGCHTFVPWLRENDRGSHVVNIASVAAFASGPAMGAYNVAKAGVVALSETLYAELARTSVGVTVVCPGFFASGLLSRAHFTDDAHRETVERFTERSRIDCDAVARATLKAMGRKKLYVVLPFRARILWRIKRLSPSLFAWLMSKIYRESASE
jgi:NAD(P)-dependent dehydrogenase (short-subunit alcohol dehydrogenase family)